MVSWVARGPVSTRGKPTTWRWEERPPPLPRLEPGTPNRAGCRAWRSSMTWTTSATTRCFLTGSSMPGCGGSRSVESTARPSSTPFRATSRPRGGIASPGASARPSPVRPSPPPPTHIPHPPSRVPLPLPLPLWAALERSQHTHTHTHTHARTGTGNCTGTGTGTHTHTHTHTHSTVIHHAPCTLPLQTPAASLVAWRFWPWSSWSSCPGSSEVQALRVRACSRNSPHPVSSPSRSWPHPKHTARPQTAPSP